MVELLRTMAALAFCDWTPVLFPTTRTSSRNITAKLVVLGAEWTLTPIVLFR